MNKKLLTITAAVFCLMSFKIQAQFTGDGFYRITNYDTGDYISYESPTDDSSSQPIDSQGSEGTNTIFHFVEYSTGVYNIISDDGARLLSRSTNTNVFSRPNNETNRDKGDSQFTMTASSVYSFYKDGTTAAPYTLGQTYLISNTADGEGEVQKQLKDHTGTKLRAANSTASSIVKWFIEKVPTTFDGAGRYRIKNASNTANYITFGTPTSSSNVINLSTDNTGDETIFQIAANDNNPGKYTIYTNDGVRFMAAVNGSSVLNKKPSESNSIDDEIAVFDIVRRSGTDDSYSIGITYSSTDYFLRDNEASDVNTGTDPSLDLQRWIFEYVGESTLSSDDQIENTTNVKVYPVPSTDGIFYLQNEAAWSVYAVTGALVAKGDGTTIDLSNAPKGIYILQYNGTSTRIISQ